MIAPRPIEVTRLPIVLRPDPRRVITRLFTPQGRERTQGLIWRIMSLGDDEVSAMLKDVIADFGSRHPDVIDVFERHYLQACHQYTDGLELSTDHRLLLGSYFTSEYSIESVALFNPSIVPDPDQSGVPDGACRFILSLRATGEQHISSIAFRSGVIDVEGNIEMDEVTPHVIAARPVPSARYDKHTFSLKLREMGAHAELTDAILGPLPHAFTFEDLERTCGALDFENNPADLIYSTVDNVLWLARSNYHVSFAHRRPVCEQVIFPVSEVESRGIEDARFVRFIDDDGSVHYHATYTAYNGFNTLPMLITTTDFHTFKISTLNGRCVRNKGMALFPRRINGRFTMLSRMDGENLYIMDSDNLHFWDEAQHIKGPAYPWEFVQIGNCGSPIETDKGWLVLTHGVGAMRTYYMGICLLDLEDPSRLIARLRQPLLAANEEERDGYVPNVVYSCGGMVHNDQLFVPYAMSDTASAFAMIPLENLWEHLGV